MAKKVEKIDNYFVLTDTVSGTTEIELPANLVYYTDDGTSIFIRHVGHNNVIGDVTGYELADLVDSTSTPFADYAAALAFFRSSTGFNSASGSSGALKLSQHVDGYSDLEDGEVIGDLAYVDTSEGTAWLPGTIGGTYYPKGIYLWNGSAWISDRNAIAETLANIDVLNLATKFKGSSVISASEVDWDDEQVRTKTLGGNTVLTFANLYIGVKDLEITGNYTLGFPANFKVITGTYDGSVANLIEIICTDTSTPAGWITISQEA